MQITSINTSNYKRQQTSFGCDLNTGKLCRDARRLLDRRVEEFSTPRKVGIANLA
jgi:hypothetical protein